MKHHVDPHLPLLVTTITPKEKGVADPTLHAHTIVTAVALTRMRISINTNADERTAQP